MVEFTDWALQILERADGAARRFNPAARIRVFRANGGVKFALTDRAEDGDQVVEHERFTLLVEKGIDGVIDVVEPHDQLVLRERASGG